MARDQSVLQTPRQPVEHRMIARPGGASIAVSSYGPVDGDIVVLVHGFAVNARYWYPQVNGLADSYRVVTYDQRGHGRSALGTDITLNDHLGQDLDAVLDEMIADRQRAVIVGHSMGGMSVMSWAVQFPAGVRRYARAIMLAGTAATAPVTKAPIHFGDPATLARRAEYEFAWLAFRTIHWPGGDLMMRTGMAVAGALFPGISRSQLKFLDSLLRETDWRTREKVGRSLENLHVERGLANMTVPVAVVVGDRDRLTPPRLADPVAHALRYTGWLERYEIWPGATHLLNWEQPERFNRTIEELFAADVPG
jgi:non-heme chloroperoxidase